MDIDEVIQEFEELAECWLAKSYYLSYKYKQIAEWLKERRDISKVKIMLLDSVQRCIEKVMKMVLEKQKTEHINNRRLAYA